MYKKNIFKQTSYGGENVFCSDGTIAGDGLQTVA